MDMSDKKETRILGRCWECNKQLVEEADHGFWLYNVHLPERDPNRIYFLYKFDGTKPRYKCGTCATDREIQRTLKRPL